jgi:hypothetical protein
MSGIKDQERIEALRKRLYERGKPEIAPTKHTLSDVKEKVKTSWDAMPKPKLPKAVIPQGSKTTTPPIAEGISQEEISEEKNLSTMAPKKKKRAYRAKILLAGIGFFVLSMVLSSLFLLFGNNSISAENITISVTGPFTIGGGEVLPLQVGITNDNAVAIESATLIVEYPRGTLSATDERTELYTEHLALDTVASGETINVPLRALVFGEENDEKNIKVSIEYRVQGSNATFFKEADPLRFKISSSPVTIRVAALKKVSSGQETDLKVVITSNSPTALSEVLVKAEYPLGFDFTSSKPSPVGSQNIWLIKDLEPEESQTITITGVVVGKETDEYAINFSVGVPNERDQQTLASVFVTAQTQFEIEHPFIDINLEVDGTTGEDVVLEAGEHTGASIEIKNTLSDTVYDMVVEVQLGGNALSDLDIGPPNGFYDSVNNKIIWDVSNAPSLQEVRPGQKIRLSFGLEPSSEALRTPQITLNVNVKARRVSESDVAEALLGTAQSVIKVVSSPHLRTTVGYNSDAFNDSGPVPPVAEQKTTYTVSLMIENGSNDISDAVITAVLPSYVTWLDQTSGTGRLSYDSAQRTLTWKVNSVDAYDAVFSSFQVAITPSKTQIGESPILLKEQNLKAQDRFTGTVVRSSAPAVSTEMSQEAGHPRDNGRVVE